MDTTETALSISFDTDFGVTFGHIICFDILHEEPAASLLKNNVTNFVFPSMWISELPFLTAIQIQQGWAHANGVNLLAAGISDPKQGSTGSGIYSSTQGALERKFSSNRKTVALIRKVSKIPGLNEVTLLTTEKISSELFLLRDFISGYTIEPLVANDKENNTNLCYKDFCCKFDYQLKDELGESESSVSII